MTTALEEVTKMQAEARKQLEEAERIGRLSAEYPDLKKHTGRWGKVAYYSASVNALTNDYDYRYNCGCCSDSPLEIWPYLETPNGRVYSDPPSFMVGEKSYHGPRPYSNWEEDLRKAGISDPIIERVQGHFDRAKEEALESVRLSFDEPSDEPDPII